jgi:hypothetical protein
MANKRMAPSIACIRFKMHPHNFITPGNITIWSFAGLITVIILSLGGKFSLLGRCAFQETFTLIIRHSGDPLGCGIKNIAGSKQSEID